MNEDALSELTLTPVGLQLVHRQPARVADRFPTIGQPQNLSGDQMSFPTLPTATRMSVANIVSVKENSALLALYIIAGCGLALGLIISVVSMIAVSDELDAWTPSASAISTASAWQVIGNGVFLIGAIAIFAGMVVQAVNWQIQRSLTYHANFVRQS